jgi:hypothetical protein
MKDMEFFFIHMRPSKVVLDHQIETDGARESF